jgi:hypothetical protein
MEQTPQVGPDLTPVLEPVIDPTVQFDGVNAKDVLDFMRQEAPDNLPVRGGIQLEPTAPGDPLTMMVELEDGTIHTLVTDQILKSSALQRAIKPVTEPLV